MIEFKKKAEVYKSGIRGTHIIIPIKVIDNKSFSVDGFSAMDFENDELSDFSELIKKKCEAGYVKKYVQSNDSKQFAFAVTDTIGFANPIIYLFENGIGFLTLFAICKNSEISIIYQLVNNGYIGDQNKTNVYELMYDRISELITPCNMEIICKEKLLLLNEAYVLNNAFVGERFDDLETLDLLTQNVHKQIFLEREFDDKSEKDIIHSYGARDVDEGTYRWGCSISTLDISFVFFNDIVNKTDNLIKISKKMQDDISGNMLLTLFVLLQKYTCKQLNEEIHNKIHNENGKKINKSTIRCLKNKALEFRAYGTLSSCQISRWNNVCEIYRGLSIVMGIEESLTEIEQKIDLLNAEQERQASKSQNLIASLVAVFGLISIIASVLSIIDYLTSGDTIMLIWFLISSGVSALFAVGWLISYLRR